MMANCYIQSLLWDRAVARLRMWMAWLASWRSLVLCKWELWNVQIIVCKRRTGRDQLDLFQLERQLWLYELQLRFLWCSFLLLSLLLEEMCLDWDVRDGNAAPSVDASLESETKKAINIDFPMYENKCSSQYDRNRSSSVETNRVMMLERQLIAPITPLKRTMNHSLVTASRLSCSYLVE